MKLKFLFAGGLFAIAAGVVSAPGSAGAAPGAPGAAMATQARPAAPTRRARQRVRYEPGIHCIRAPCYVPRRPHRPWYARHHFGRYYGRPLVCHIRYGYYRPRQVCRPILL